MSILETRAPAAPSRLWSMPHTAIVSVVAYARMFAESFAEAQRMAREAERRFPNTFDW